MTLLVTQVAAWPGQAHAAVAPGCDTSASFLGFPTWYKYLDIGPAINDQGQAIVDSDGNTVDPCAVIGPLQGDGSDTPYELDWASVVSRVAIAVTEMLLRISALIAVGYVVYGGFRFITSQGDPEGVKSARQTIQNSLIGLIICMISIGTVTFIGSQFL